MKVNHLNHPVKLIYLHFILIRTLSFLWLQFWRQIREQLCNLEKSNNISSVQAAIKKSLSCNLYTSAPKFTDIVVLIHFPVYVQ